MSRPEVPTYYDQPVLQKPVWIWAVPAYFYAGGTAGAVLVLAAAAELADARGLAGLVERCRKLGAGGLLLGSGLLIYDLGRPARFLNMLRVFRPTSPLSIGSWLLAAGGAASGAAALLNSDRAGRVAGLLGLPLAGYTGVVLANTAVPAWQRASRTLPALFVSSAMAGAAALLEMSDLTRRESAVVKRFGVIGKAAELGFTIAVEREATGTYKRSALWKAAKVLSAASLVLSLFPGRSRRKRTLAGVAGTAGAVLLRFAAIEAGRVSASDPRATFGPQRSMIAEQPRPEQAAVKPAAMGVTLY